MTYKKHSIKRLKAILKNNKLAMKQFFFNPTRETNEGFVKENYNLQAELNKRKKK